jgi:dethiobiotin synthetase
MTPHPSPLTPRGYFVTGTDTDVGKTLLACALLHAFAARGLRVCGMKPVAAGAAEVDGVLVNDDVAQLIAAGNIEAPREQVNPYCFAPAVAPHIAAAASGRPIRIDVIEDRFGQLTQRADVVIVEGAGGFCVPLNDTHSSADLAHRLALPVILVVGMRLGCLNHALLTAQAIRARGLALAGWVANHIDAAMAEADANVAALQSRLDAPLLARIAHNAAPDAAAIAQQLDLRAMATSSAAQ